MGAWKRLLSAMALALILAAPVVADVRKDNIDVIIALDRSLSMEHKIVAVKSWVNTSIIDQLLIPGDFLAVIAFYGKAEPIVSQTITGDADRKALKQIISQLRGNGRFTDIGNALDAVKAQLAAKESDGREKYVLLLTDGIQEAPPTSKYYSKNGVFNHDFLANTKTIQQKGWKVMILGIGTDTAAKDLARELQGTYSEITNKLTAKTLTETAGGLLATAAVQGPVNVSPIGADGASRVSFTLKPSGLSGDATITIRDLNARVGTRSVPWLLDRPFTLTVKKDAPLAVSIPVHFLPVLAPGTSAAVLSFTFASAERFTPAELPVSLRVNGLLQNYLVFFIVGLILVLALIAFVASLIWRLTSGKPVRFGLLIDDERVGPEVISLTSGRECFLNESASAFTLVQKRNAKSLGRFTVKDGKLALGVLKQDRFPKLAESPAEARGKTFVVKSDNGKNHSMKVQTRERKK